MSLEYEAASKPLQISKISYEVDSTYLISVGILDGFEPCRWVWNPKPSISSCSSLLSSLALSDTQSLWALHTSPKWVRVNHDQQPHRGRRGTLYRGTSSIRNRPPPGITLEP